MEYRLLGNSKGEDDHLFERVDIKLFNSLQGKIQWIWSSRKWDDLTVWILDEAKIMDYFIQGEPEKYESNGLGICTLL